MATMSQAPTLSSEDVPVCRMVRFGLFEVDKDAGELRRGGSAVRLRLQSFKVLAALVDRPGQVVSREDLRLRLWGGQTYVDFDQGLNACIKEVRAALGDSSDAPLYVETLPRRGYRFIAPIVPETISLPTAVTEGAPAVGSAATASPGAQRLVQPALLLAAGVLLGIALALASAARRAQPEPDWQRLTFQRGVVTSARFAPGGEVVFSAAWDGGIPSLHSVLPGSPDARPLALEGARVVGVSRQGEIAYLRARPGSLPMLARAPLAGGPVKDVLENVTDADLAPNGVDYAVARLLPGRLSVEYPIGHALAAVNAPSSLRVSPDGGYVALIERVRAQEDEGHVVILDREGRRVAASAAYSSAEGLSWSAEGREVWFTAAAAGADTALRAVDLGSRERVILPSSGRMALRDVDRAGRMLMERASLRSEVAYVDGGVTRDLSWLDRSRAAALASDGTSVLLNELGLAQSQRAIYLRPTDGSPPLRVGTGSAGGFLPGGADVVAVPSAATGSIADRIHLLPIGPGEPRALRHAGIALYDWALALPDGRLLFVGGEPRHNMRVWLGDLRGSAPRPITPEGLVASPALVSPEEGFLVARCPPLRFCVYPFDGERRVIADIDNDVPLGLTRPRSLLLQPRGAGFPVRVDRLDLDSGRRSPWHELRIPDPVGVTGVRNVIVRADGEAYAFNYERRLSELFLVPAPR
jgi:DNA-binding winged helix-turn-helix (wHTH) protein